MISPEQDKSLSTIAALAASLSKQNLTSIQLDLVQAAERVLVNVALQQTEFGRLANKPEEPKPQAPVFQEGEPCRVYILANRVQHAHWQKATVTGKEARHTVEGGFVYQTSATGKQWVTINRLEKWTQ